jgi:hypothetical protein
VGVVRSGEIERGTESRSIRFGIRRRVPSNSEQDDEERGGHEVGGEEVLREDPIKAQELVRSTFARSLGEGTRQTTPGEAHESRAQPAHEVGGVARARQLMDERSTVERGQERRRLRRTYRAHVQRYKEPPSRSRRVRHQGERTPSRPRSEGSSAFSPCPDATVLTRQSQPRRHHQRVRSSTYCGRRMPIKAEADQGGRTSSRPRTKKSLVAKAKGRLHGLGRNDLRRSLPIQMRRA